MNIAEQISAFQTKRTQITERMKALMALSADEGRTLTDDEQKEFGDLQTEVVAVDAHLKRWKDIEALDAETAEPPVQQRRNNSMGNGAPRILSLKQDPDDKFKGQAFVRRCIAQAVAVLGNHMQTPAQVAQSRWGKSNPLLVEWIKAGVAGGGTGSGEWGAELVTADGRFTGDFIEFLQSVTVYDQLNLRVVPAHVTIKGQDGGATANWVGESKAIPVSAQDYLNVTLTPLKVAAISVVSNELLKYASPDAELLVRDALIQAISQRIDITFLSTSAAVAGVSPAGILNGLTSLGSNGWDAEDIRSDIKELWTPFIQAKYNTELVLVLNPARAKATSLLANDLGQTEFPGLNANGGTLLGDRVVTGHNVGADHAILLAPQEIYRIGDDGIEVSVSREATIEQDSAPAGASDTPTASSATLMSMFGTDSTAFKVVRPINFAKRRTTAVAFISDARWGDVGSVTS